MYQWKPFLTEQVFNLFPNFDNKDAGTADWTLCWPGTTTFRSYFMLYPDMLGALFGVMSSINTKFA